MATISLQEVIGQLETLFSNFNSHLFDNELEKPVITVSPNTNRDAFGWCTLWKAWKENDENNESEGYYEINICADYLNMPFEELANTMIHEMVHLLNLQNEVQDNSRSGLYHNKHFKQVAEEHGLTVEKHEKYGWCITKLNDTTLEYIQTIKGQSFNLYRSKALKLKGSTKNNSKKYVCSVCGAIIRATKEVNVICADCKVEFICEG